MVQHGAQALVSYVRIDALRPNLWLCARRHAPAL